jgi:hypothetical protein
MHLTIDTALGIWIALVLAAFLARPTRTLLVFSLTMPLVAAANLLNWLTALMVGIAALAVTRQDVSGAALFSRFSRVDLRSRVAAAMSSAGRVPRRVRAVGGVALIAAAAPAVQAVLNTRLPSTDDYSLLASTHRLMSGEWEGLFLPAPSLVAIVSLISGADPLQVVRFLKPVLHIACALSAANLARRTTGQRELAWLTGAASGVALVSVQASLDLLALTMLAAGFALLHKSRRQHANVVGAYGLLAVSVSTVPALVIFAGAGGAVILGAPLAFVAEGLGVLLVAASLVEPHLFDGTASMGPYLATLGAGLLLHRILETPVRGSARLLRRVPYSREVLVTAALLMFALQPGGTMYAEYVEPDSAAREALVLKRSPDAGRWAVVGTQEQRIQMGPAIAVIDLQEFVVRYGAVAGTPGFRFDLPVDRVFVFVEKRPVSPTRAGLSRRFAELDRPVYLIPRLRADLQRAALDLCEAYRRAHAGVSIHYEDETLRIYSFAL